MKMKLFLLLSLGCCCVLSQNPQADEVQSLKHVVGQLAREVLLTQQRLEDAVRLDGDSGLKQKRSTRDGTRTYHSDTIQGRSFAATHDHANNIRTIGMGEVAAVLNGVQFRTRHNDYSLKMASTTSGMYQATEDVPFPDVPQRVLDQPTVAAQVTEMKEWFKAWRDQDPTVRDYTQHFKPVLCYMEGMWTYPQYAIEESFQSDRHFLDANNWFELEEKVRYFSYSGAKGSGENAAFLPRSIVNVTEEGYPVFAQWNYNILCHPLANDVPLDRFRVVDDLSARMRTRINLGRFEETKAARFKLNIEDEPFIQDSIGVNKYLDSLMYQIPGKNNYGANFEDMGLGDNVYMDPNHRDVPINAGYYHRYFYQQQKDAMGLDTRRRGFADANLYTAMTNQSNLVGMKVTVCKRKICRVVDQTFSYAIPLEIIYLTPLSKWNPYNITYRGDPKDPDFNLVTAGNANGNPGSPLNGINSKRFYQTPSEFYDRVGGNEVDPDPADTTPRRAVAVLDWSGTERYVRATGHRIFLPEIEGVGKLRQRYPIAPVHGEGSPMWKEIEALKEIVMDPLSHGHLMYNPITAAAGFDKSGPFSMSFTFQMSESSTLTNRHTHEFTINQNQFLTLRKLENVTVSTSVTEGHSHTLVLFSSNGELKRLRYQRCDEKRVCPDGHGKNTMEIRETV